MPQKKQRIDELMEKVGAAMARTAYFEAERLAVKALQMARQDADFDGPCRRPGDCARNWRLTRAMCA
ncbi:MAG TPA: hypothetical protein PK400_03915 [Phycisphaerales bacterium]|nr:hypothetical protein [Phycisphaerales bacterium]